MHYEEVCDARIGGQEKWIWRQRSDGTKYRFPANVGGHRCSNAAVVARSRNGRTVRRCLTHATAR
jgi:hypothetical protein